VQYDYGLKENKIYNTTQKVWNKITGMTEQQITPTAAMLPKHFHFGLLQFQIFFQNLQLPEGDLNELL
jgi:hypothetical protein